MIVLSDKVVITRKDHTCFMCVRRFPKGSKMRSQTNTYDGICSVYTCETCDELKNHIEPDEENMYWEGDTIEYMDSEKFKGTPEEYLATLEARKEKP